MSPFERRSSLSWHREIPGARWFRCDLHIHTLDDHPGGVQWPNGLSGDPCDPDVQTRYARALLQAAIKNGIEILGLTPHAIKAGADDQTSTTWRIIDEWNTALDDDGVPFRDKIYAIFPGFEPNLNTGSNGLHLIFLFDPEIGREHFIAAYNAVMGGVSPWSKGNLRISNLSASKAFDHLARQRDRLERSWDYFCIAPHAFGDHGLFNVMKGQVLQWFEHGCISGLELSDNWLPEDALENRRFLEEGMPKYRHAFFHSSDAYSVTDIGKRWTLLKMATPRIESLRQAFLASDSRLRIPYVRGENNTLVVHKDIPTAIPMDRPWMRSITVRGGAAFFSSTNTDGSTNETTFAFNPDFTAVIGPRMTGKSTLLDGARVYFGHEMPSDDRTAQGVRERGNEKFLGGGASVSTDVRGPMHDTAELFERWPAQFFTQRELREAADDASVLRNLLRRLVPEHSQALVENDEAIQNDDDALNDIAKKIAQKRGDLFDALSHVKESSRAIESLARFEEAGIKDLVLARVHAQSIQDTLSAYQDDENILVELKRAAEDRKLPDDIDDRIALVLSGPDGEPPCEELFTQYQQILSNTVNLREVIWNRLNTANELAKEIIIEVQENVVREVVKNGGNAEDVSRFEGLADRAGRHEHDEKRLLDQKSEMKELLRQFSRQYRSRQILIEQQRQAMEALTERVQERFEGRLRIVTRKEIHNKRLNEWIRGFKSAGITRWWNSHDRDGMAYPTPVEILAAVRIDSSQSIGMSDDVWNTFQPLMDKDARINLRAFRNEDDYELQLLVDPENEKYKSLRQLSGGAQVAVLLSLVLEAADERPLVIDQPEDELDKDFLFEHLLPALRRMKGKRQIIFATHDANIVVNGDADHVLCLQATSEQGRVKVSGAIDDPAVRNAIISVLDGGPEAFDLRRAKYGY